MMRRALLVVATLVWLTAWVCLLAGDWGLRCSGGGSGTDCLGALPSSLHADGGPAGAIGWLPLVATIVGLFPAVVLEFRSWWREIVAVQRRFGP